MKNLNEIGLQELTKVDLKRMNGGNFWIWLAWEIIDPGNAGDAKAGQDFVKGLYGE